MKNLLTTLTLLTFSLQLYGFNSADGWRAHNGGKSLVLSVSNDQCTFKDQKTKLNDRHVNQVLNFFLLKLNLKLKSNIKITDLKFKNGFEILNNSSFDDLVDKYLGDERSVGHIRIKNNEQELQVTVNGKVLNTWFKLERLATTPNHMVELEVDSNEKKFYDDYGNIDLERSYDKKDTCVLWTFEKDNKLYNITLMNLETNKVFLNLDHLL